jgi:putative DNA primase/helicase
MLPQTTVAPTDPGIDLTELRLALRRRGYRPVPVSSAHLAIKSAGKRPLMRGWETLCADAGEDEIRRWARAQRNCTNTGLLCGDIVGVDIDVPLAGPAAAIEALARDMLGDTQLKRIGRAPKLLLVLRAERPFDKLQTPELLVPDGTALRVEVLARGQQFVGFGAHPDTGADYHWPGHSPLDVPAAALPVVDRERCAAFVTQAEAALRGMGAQSRSECREKERIGRQAVGRAATQTDTGPPERDLIADALAHIPNDDLPYDDWVRVGFALYHGLGADGCDLWTRWSAQSAKNDPVVTAEKWPGFAEGRSITVNTLFWLARQHGWNRAGGRRRRTAPRADADDTRPASSGGRPTIRVRGGALPLVVDDAERALLAARLPLYQRGSMVVRSAISTITTADGRKIPAPRLVAVTRHHIAEAMTVAAAWERFDQRAGEWLATDCPLRIADTYLARDGLWRLPVLTGMIGCPTLRADGSILERPGYDTVTGLLFDPQGAAFFPMIDRPDRDQALAALSYLRALIGTFPFVGDADRAVALSAILTALIRCSLSAAPLHGFSAPTAGTGKSLLVDIAGMIATGRPVSVIAQGKTEEEMEKRLGAALIAGDPLISIDNCATGLGGELLCQTLTQPMLKVRILGRSVNAEVPTVATVFATGNNLAVVGDMSRRTIRCSLDAGVERPELREFARDPVATVAASRADYVSAALTLLRAYHVAGQPQQTTPLGSFTDWSRRVRDALIWLGEADPCATMEAVRDADPRLESLNTVVAQWSAHLGNRRVSVKEAIDVAADQRAAGFYSGRMEFVNPEFREALLTVAGDGGAISGRRLGKWLAAHQGRIVHGMKFQPDGVVAGIARWRLTRVGEDARIPDSPPPDNVVALSAGA